MGSDVQKPVSTWSVVIAFIILYIVWGSTYFFIQMGVEHIPPFLMGALRFVIAGILLMIWCLIKKENLFNSTQIKYASITGIFLLFVGTGAVIWAEKTIPSSLVAVLVASQAIWLVLFDKRNWKENFTSKSTIIGLIIGFLGVILLFSESAGEAIKGRGDWTNIVSLIVLIIGTISWTAGSIYSKYHSFGSTIVNSSWQMIAAGIVFLLVSLFSGETRGFDWKAVPAASWWSVVYLIIMGSLAGFSAYVFLLKVRPVSQVGTHVYINPVVAVLLGVFIAGEKMTLMQVIGLAVILTSVLLINLARYRQTNKTL
jgi:drug/metabolite transporter (DMT)-like permease